MNLRPPHSIGARTAAGGLTLTVHGLLVMVLLIEDRDLVRPLPASRAPAQMWIHLASIQAAPPLDAPGRSGKSPLPLRPIAPSARAIVPTPQAAPQQPGSIEGNAVPSSVDWELMAQQRAGNYGREEDRSTFGEPLAKTRKPCRARDSSFEWSPEEERAGFFPLPYMMIGERCVIVLGFFSCALNAGAPPSKHLFDDMQGGRTPHSSVPDPDSCD